MTDNAAPKKPLLNAKDIAARYGKSVSNVYHLNCYTPEKLPPSIKIGNALRWRPEDVEAWEKALLGKAVTA